MYLNQRIARKNSARNEMFKNITYRERITNIEIRSIVTRELLAMFITKMGLI